MNTDYTDILVLFATMPRKVSPPVSEHHRLRDPLTDGEKMVFEFFDTHLDEAWEIYIQPHMNGLRPDFVLLNPNVGIAVFEVKDWSMRSGLGRRNFHCRDTGCSPCSGLGWIRGASERGAKG